MLLGALLVALSLGYNPYWWGTGTDDRMIRGHVLAIGWPEKPEEKQICAYLDGQPPHKGLPFVHERPSCDTGKEYNPLAAVLNVASALIATFAIVALAHLAAPGGARRKEL